MAEVEYRHATRIYPGTTTAAVSGLDLHIEDGEFMVLVGPSGSGKSTALRMLAGLEVVHEGQIMIGDRDGDRRAPKARDIAMVFQSYALYPAPDRGREHGLPAQDKKRAGRERQAAGAGGRASCSSSSPTSTAGRDSSPVVSVSASPWAARSCGSRRCSSWTSRSPTSTPSCACRPGPQIAVLAASTRRDDHLRHPRPGRGHDDGRPGRGAQGRPAAAVRHPAQPLRTPGNVFVAGLRGIPGDEPHRPAGDREPA